MKTKRLSVEDLKFIESKIKEAADQLKLDAGYGGFMSDLGADDMLRELRFYKMGWHREMPPKWDGYLKTKDPEYQEYLRLKDKFESNN